MGEAFITRRGGGGKDLSSATISAVPAQSGSLTYNGGNQTPTWSGYDAAKLTISGTTSSINAGSYTASFTPTANYKWWDGSTTAKTATWSIAKLTLTNPTVNGSRTYNGSAQEIPLNNFNATYMTRGGTYSATNAGTYSATVSLVNTDNLQWTGGTTAALTLSWTINKAQGTISVSPTSIVLSGDAGKTGTSTITKTGDGSISVTSGNTDVATASLSGLTVTVASVNTGSATITVTMAAGANYLGASCTISVFVTIVL